MTSNSSLKITAEAAKSPSLTCLKDEYTSTPSSSIGFNESDSVTTFCANNALINIIKLK